MPGVADREPRAARDGAPVRGRAPATASSGVLATSDWPPEALAKPKVGDSRALDLERILLLKPDLVVTWPFAAPAQVGVLHRARHSGFHRQSGDDRRHRQGHGAARRPRGHDAGRRPRERPSSARSSRSCRTAYAAMKTVRVFYEIWDVPLYTIGGHHLISQALTVCGGENVFAALVAAGAGRQRRGGARGEAATRSSPARMAPCGRLGSTTGSAGRRCRRSPTAISSPSTPTSCIAPGPRFIDGMETLCAAVAKARAAAP